MFRSKAQSSLTPNGTTMQALISSLLEANERMVCVCACAESQDFNDRLNFPPCSLCHQLKDDLKVFPCLHGYCGQCSDVWTNKDGGSESETASCQLCKGCQNHPQLVDSPANAYVRLMLKAKRIDKTPMMQCDACPSRVSSELYYCTECCQQFCGECTARHAKISATRCHHVVPISKRIPVDVAIACSEHAKAAEPVVAYCKECKSYACNTCMRIHWRHDYVEIQEQADTCRSRLDAEVEEIGRSIEECEQWHKQLVDNKKQWETNVEIIHGIISKNTESASDQVQLTKQRLDGRLKKLDEDGLCQLKQTLDGNQRKIQNLRCIKQVLESVSSYGSACEIVSFCNSTPTYAESTWPSHKPAELRLINFKPTDFGSFLPSNFDFLGSIKFDDGQMADEETDNTLFTWNSMRDRLTENEKAIHNLTDQLRDMECLKQQHEQHVEENTVLQHRLKGLESEIGTVTDKLKQAMEQLKEKETLLEKERSESKAQSAEIKDLRIKEANISTALKEKETNEQQTNECLQKTTAELTESRSKVNELTAKLESKTKEITRLTTLTTDQAKRLEELSVHKDNADQRLVQISQEYASIQSTLDCVKRSSNETKLLYEQQFNRYKQEVQNMTDQLTQLSVRKQQLEAHINQLLQERHPPIASK